MRIKLSLVMLAAALMLSSCGPKSHEVEHVFFIGLDGWGSYSVENSDMTNVKQLMKDGAWTIKKRTVLPSHSATNWAAMFMGVGPEIHGFYECCSEKPDLEPRYLSKNGIFPTVFQLLREKEPDAEIGCLHEWSGIKYLIDTLSVSYEAKVPQADLCEESCKYILEKKPRFAAFVYDDPDHVGHSAGHDTPEYYKKLKELDGWIGKTIEAIKEAGIWDKSVVVITSDHGGINYGHGGISMMEMETPLIVCGKGIKKDFCFDDVSVMQFDVAAILADLLGVKLPEQSYARNVEQIYE